MLNHRSENQPLLSFTDVCAYGTYSPSAVNYSNDLTVNSDVAMNMAGFKRSDSATNSKPAKTFNLSNFYTKARSQFSSLRLKLSVASSRLGTSHPLLLDNASGQLLSGQLTVLTGSSGSGKSVLLRLLAGLTPMSTGDIYLNGSSIFNIEPTHWRTQVALLGQHPQLIEGSVLDNLQLPYTLQAHKDRQFDKQWHLKQLAYLQRDEPFLYQSTAYLSGGERQLVNILRLLQLNPQVLLLDEPTAALDPQTALDLITLLVNWLHSDLQRTLLWITHDIDSITPFADSHWHMQAGRLTKLN